MIQSSTRPERRREERLQAAFARQESRKKLQSEPHKTSLNRQQRQMLQSKRPSAEKNQLIDMIKESESFSGFLKQIGFKIYDKIRPKAKVKSKRKKAK